MGPKNVNLLVPELDVRDLERSLGFYVETIGFRVVYQRLEERFAFLEYHGAELMLEEAAGPGRRIRTAPLEPPFGRGINFQIACPDPLALERRLIARGVTPLLPLEERRYRRDAIDIHVRQFWVEDPDGYVLRFASEIGRFATAPA
jgi:catechol 2,3-dioxygenase-like lactoylglutathione lyase family enzyme